MKHPVDTSAWGDFVVGQLFDNITRGTRLKKSDRKPGATPLVTAGSENQGIAEHILENKELFDGITLTIDMFGNVFARNYPFYADDNILVLQTNVHTFNQIQFMAGSLAHLANEYGYTNQFRQNTLNNTTIKLPLKPSADPSNYDQTDIDWTYMETVMSRVTARAKDRLASLPQPTDKKKTPVDTSSWGEFVVGELFDVHPTKAYKLKNSELLTTTGQNPVVVNSSYNNGIGGYTDQELTESGGVLTFSDTTSGADTLFFQEKPFVGYPHVQGVYPKTFQLTTDVAKFMIASLRASINKYSWNYTNKLTRTFIASATIKLPLKLSVDLSNYTQDDIDWDYMEKVMKAIEEKAQTRLKTLQKAIA